MYTKIKKIGKIFLSLSLIVSTNIPLPVFAKSSDIECYDTISGMNTFIEVVSNANENAIITISKPDDSKLILVEKTDNKGNLYEEIDSFHLKETGNYIVNYQDTNYEQNLTCGFEVLAGKPDFDKSSIEIIGSNVAMTGNDDSIKIKITLRDKNDNRVEGYAISLIPSREEDNIDLENIATDENGVIFANLSSSKSGTSSVSIFDSIENKILKNRVEAIFMEGSNSSQKEVGGFWDFGLASIFDSAEANQDYEEISKFKIEGIEDSVKVGETVNLTITAQDEKENTVLNYNGEILFSTTDELAKIPEEPYEFIEDDMGEHTFNLAFTFLTPGKQTLNVNDTENYDLRSSIDFEVIESDSTTDNESDENDSGSVSEITLESPKSGTYNDGITFSGKGPASTEIKFYLNDKMTDKITSDEEGLFSKKITNLGGGLYTVYAASEDKNGNIIAKSDEVSLKIDSEAAVVDEVQIEPEEVEINGTVFITILSEPYLPQVSIILEDKITDLTEDSGHTGKYSAKITAPKTSGEHKIDVILVDELGKEAIYSEYATLNVTELSAENLNAEDISSTTSDVAETAPAEETITAEEPIDNTENPDQIDQTEAQYPDQVTGVEIANIESSKITLNWEVAASSSDKFIQNYRIYYGTDAENLDQSIDTFDSSTTWYIPYLTNDTVYYFAITAIDSDGLESQIPSQIVSATPIGDEEVQAEEDHGAANIDEEQEEGLENADEVPESGPNLYIIIIATLILGDLYLRVKDKLIK